MTSADPAPRFVLDQGIPCDTAVLLEHSGFSAVHVSALGMQSAEDSAIIQWARQQQSTVVTLDSDFHILVSVIRTFASEIKRGCLITVKDRKTTCHLLPVGK